jgi:ABC-2 type transport system permease protein
MSARATIGAAFRRSFGKALYRPVALSFSLVQPLIWMLFFGFLFQRYRIERSGGAAEIPFLDFLVPGIASMTVLFGASQSGIELIRDLQTGFLQRVLRTPAAGSLLLAGKLLADTARLLVQAGLVVLLGYALGARLEVDAPALIVAVVALSLFAIAFAALSCALALVTRTPETMAVFVHIVNMPLIFTSTALVPRRQMPGWLATLSHANPLTVAVDALRRALLRGGTPELMPLLALLALAAALFAIASAALTRAARG